MKIKYFLFLLFFISCLFSYAEKAKSSKSLPSYLQKAYILQKDAIIYSRPDFDSLKITQIPAGTIVTISRKVYRPKSLFGTFYRIYLTKPKKMRAYISEIDVVPRFIKSGSGYKRNPEFEQAKKKVHHIKQFEANKLNSDEELDLSDGFVHDRRFIGMTAGYSLMSYADIKLSFSAWFFSLKLTGPGLPIRRVVTDITFSFSSTTPVINNHVFNNGFVVFGDILFKMPIINAPNFLLYLAGGIMLKWKGVFAAPANSPPTRYQLGAGVGASAGLLINFRKHWGFLAESKCYYDIQENRFLPLWLGGILVGF